MVRPAGNHLAFPFRVSPNGSMEQVSDPKEHVRLELIQLVLTDVGERLFLPEFGGGVRGFVFKNISEEVSSITKSTLTQALTQWIGHRLKVEDLTITVEEEQLSIEIKYSIAGTEDIRDISFKHIGG